MSQVASYRDLVVWQKAMLLTEEVYRLSEGFPSREQYGITSQLRRATVSVAANLAEGHSRNEERLRSLCQHFQGVTSRGRNLFDSGGPFGVSHQGTDHAGMASGTRGK